MNLIKLKQYLKKMPNSSQEYFAKKCKVSLGYLKKAISIRQKLSAETAIAIEIASNGEVKCEDLRPDINWQSIKSKRVN